MWDCTWIKVEEQRFSKILYDSPRHDLICVRRQKEQIADVAVIVLTSDTAMFQWTVLRYDLQLYCLFSTPITLLSPFAFPRKAKLASSRLSPCHLRSVSVSREMQVICFLSWRYCTLTFEYLITTVPLVMISTNLWTVLKQHVLGFIGRKCYPFRLPSIPFVLCPSCYCEWFTLFHSSLLHL